MKDDKDFFKDDLKKNSSPYLIVPGGNMPISSKKNLMFTNCFITTIIKFDNNILPTPDKLK
ncbi:MAG: hypothetical protein IPI93_09340 [Sphingobacteriaceae bacterium]|nr:hypothetical protein [Sphingobacteriaceae bacterium]